MTDIDSHWARARVEAMAEGSLAPGDARRMRAAMQRDPALRAAAERAGALRAALVQLADTPVPRTLLRRLWAMPRRSAPARPRRARTAWRLAVPAAAALAAVLLQHAYNEREREREAAQALAQLELAMTYVEQSSAVASAHVAEALRTSMRAAAATSRKALRGKDEESANGG